MFLRQHSLLSFFIYPPTFPWLGQTCIDRQSIIWVAPVRAGAPQSPGVLVAEYAGDGPSGYNGTALGGHQSSHPALSHQEHKSFFQLTLIRYATSGFPSGCGRIDLVPEQDQPPMRIMN